MYHWAPSGTFTGEGEHRTHLPVRPVRLSRTAAGSTGTTAAGTRGLSGVCDAVRHSRCPVTGEERRNRAARWWVSTRSTLRDGHSPSGGGRLACTIYLSDPAVRVAGARGRARAPRGTSPAGARARR